MIHSYSTIAETHGLHPEFLSLIVPTWDAGSFYEDPAHLFQGKTGKDDEVIEFILKQDEKFNFIRDAIMFLREDPEMEMAFCCRGGIFRSVAAAQHVSNVTGVEVRHHGLELFESGVHVWNLPKEAE